MMIEMLPMMIGFSMIAMVAVLRNDILTLAVVFREASGKAARVV